MLRSKLKRKKSTSSINPVRKTREVRATSKSPTPTLKEKGVKARLLSWSSVSSEEMEDLTGKMGGLLFQTVHSGKPPAPKRGKFRPWKPFQSSPKWIRCPSPHGPCRSNTEFKTYPRHPSAKNKFTDLPKWNVSPIARGHRKVPPMTPPREMSPETSRANNSSSSDSEDNLLFKPMKISEKPTIRRRKRTISRTESLSRNMPEPPEAGPSHRRHHHPHHHELKRSKQVITITSGSSDSSPISTFKFHVGTPIPRRDRSRRLPPVPRKNSRIDEGFYGA